MHDVRVVYFVAGEAEGKEIIKESAFLSSAEGGCPITGTPAPSGDDRYLPIRFGRMFGARAGFPPDLKNEKTRDELMGVAECLIDLGDCMDDPAEFFKKKKQPKPDFAADGAPSNIPAGYTYLGQFITHEVTFHKTEKLPLVELVPENIRSPSLDLDSIYGGGPAHERSKRLYEERTPGRLKVGWTQPPPPPPTDSSRRSSLPEVFQNDLPRNAGGNKEEAIGVAIIGDERNDENLPLAQTHVAFIKFHNRVIGDLDRGHYKDFPRPAAGELFEKARDEVVKHFQWIILKDYLPRLVDDDIIESVIRRPSEWFDPENEEKLFIPLEFSAAAFRIGHSMVRQRYKWNREHRDVGLFELFTNTKRSGNLQGLDRLDSTWVIDWKRFYDFRPFEDEYPRPYDPLDDFNRAAKIDTIFNIPLGRITGFKHLPEQAEDNGGGGKPDEQKPVNPLFNKHKALPVRNLLRGLSLGLPSGEDVADALKAKGLLTEQQRLTQEQLRAEPHAALLAAKALGEKTPLWFYVLREARVQGNGSRLGRVGGRIVAETLIGLIRHSRYTILKPAAGNASEWVLRDDWRPAYPRKPAEPETFKMVDLLRAADVVDPLGRRLHEARKKLTS